VTETLPENIANAYPDRSTGDAAHQHHHDVIHARLNALAATPSGLTVEQVQDTVAAMMVAGAGITLTYNDAANTLTVTSTATGTGTGVTDPEVVRDTIGVALRGAGGITVAVDDAGDTVTLTLTAIAINQVTNLSSTLAAKADLVNGFVPDEQLPATTVDKIEGVTATGAQVLTAATGEAVRVITGAFKPVANAPVLVMHTFTLASEARRSGTRTDVVEWWQGPVTPTNMAAQDIYTYEAP
jgi:hypothetical protein